MVRDETRPDDPMFAHLCDRGTIIRGSMILQLRRLSELQILRPTDWGAEELQQWVGGTLRSSVQDYRVEQTERPLRIGNVEVNDVRTLSRVFAMDWSKAETFIRGGEFAKWVQRNIPNQSICETLEPIFDAEGEGGKKSPAGRLAARVSLLLDPPAPLRYKGGHHDAERNRPDSGKGLPERR